jgi:hypothetical protein
MALLGDALSGPVSERIIALGALVLGGVALYAVSAIVFGAAAIADIRRLAAGKAADA